MRAPATVASALLLLLSAAPAAFAEPDGHVLKVDGSAIYVDLGRDDGVDAGSQLALHHVVIARHPRTGKKLRDSFELGRLTVVKAGRGMCVAEADAALLPRVKSGDQIVLPQRAAPVVDPWQRPAGSPRESVRRTPTGTDAGRREQVASRVRELEAAEAAWKATRGQSPAARAQIWRDYLSAFPNSSLAPAVRDEIASLTAQARAETLRDSPVARRAASLRARAGAHARLRALTDTDIDGPLVAIPPRRAYQGTSVDLAFLVVEPGTVTASWIHYRRAGDETYRRAELMPDNGGGYLRYQLPGSEVMPPGVDYFVEIQRSAEGAPAAVVGSAAEPEHMIVDAAVEERPPEIVGRSRVTTTVDFVDFDGGFNDGHDQYLQAEVDFMYRFYRPIYSMRIGFGTLGGDGGPKSVIDNDDSGRCMDVNGNVPCRHVNFSYAYVELEHRITPVVALLARPLVGSAFRDRDAGSREYLNSIGFRGRVRIGEERATNLVVGLGFTQHFGTLVEAAFNFDTVPNVPIVLGAQVTDQPVLEDFGVRLLLDVGYREWGWVYPSLRISYQARDIDHSGVSGGAGLNFDW